MEMCPPQLDGVIAQLNMIKMSHYYSRKQDGILRKHEVIVRLFGKEFKFETGSGMFSPKKLDQGTLLLLTSCIVKDGWNILDLGCGWGTVGVVIASEFPKSNVMMVDINERAVRIAKTNAKKLKNIEVKWSDCYSEIDEKFDAILVNPPQVAGRKLCFKMIEGAKDHLKKNGLLELVARHNKGGKELEKRMMEVFGNCEAIAKKSGYRLYVSKK